MGNVAIELTAVDRGAGRSLDALTQRLGTVNVRTEEARRETLQYRDAVNKINSEIAENNKLLLTADQVTRQSLQAKNRALSVERQLLNVQSARSRQQVAFLTQESRETRGLIRNLEGATRGTGLLSRATAGFGTVLAGVGIAVAARGVVGFGAASVRAAAQMEALERGLRLVEGSSLDAGMRLEMLREIANLPGLQLAPLVRYNNTLREVGLTTDEVDTVVTSLGNAIVSFGGDAETVDRVFTQLSQSFSQNKLEAEDFNTVLENVPSLRGIIQDVLGLSGSTEELGDAFKATGGDLIDFLLPVFQRLQTDIPTAPIDSYAASTDTLRNSFFRLQSELGERILPAIGSVSRGLAGLFDNISDGITRTKNFTETFAELNTEITRASGRIELQEAISGGVEALEVFIRQSEAAIRNNSVFFGGREDAILIGQINQANEALTELVGVQEKNIETEASLRAELVLQENELARIQGLQTDRNDLIAEQGRTAERASRIYLANLTEEEIAVNASIDDLEKKLTAYEAIPPAVDEVTASTVEATASTKALTTEVLRLTEVYNGLTRNIQQASEQAALIVESGFADFFRLVRGEITAYNASIETVIPSIANLTEAQDALTASIDANIGIMQTAIETGTDLDVVLSQLSDGLTSTAADQAIANAEFRLVNPAISSAVESFRDYNDVLSETGVNFERVDSISDRLTSSIRQGSSAFDEFSRSVEKGDERLQEFFDLITNRGNRAIDEFNENVIDTTRTYIPGLNRSINLTSGEIAALRKAAEDATPDFLFKAIDDLDAITLDNLLGEFSRLDGVVGDLGTKIGQFDLAGLATGNPLSIATLPFQLYDAFTFDQRQADALRPELNRQNQASFERGEFGIPPDLLEFGRGQLDTAALATRTSGFGGRPLLDLLEGLEPQIGRTSLDAVANLPERIRETIQTFTDQITNELTNELSQASFNLNFAGQTGGDVEGALQDVIGANTALYQAQIDSYNLQRQALGYAVGNVDELNRILNGLNNQSRLAIADLRGPQNAQQFIGANNITRGLTPGQDDQERGVVAERITPEEAAEEAERVAAEALATVIDVINADVAVINASITSIETQISQASEPAEIAALLEQIPALIETKYQRLRDALDARLNTGELSVDVYNASLSELSSGESSELERHSDAMLANVVRMIDEDIQLIDASITDINTQIAGLSDPEAIGALLEQIPGLITEKYTRLREALDAKYGAGELSVDVYNASLSLLSSRESGEIEQQSDAVLAQTIGAIDGDVALIDANIGALQLAVENSDDPDAVAGLLDAIKLLVMDKYTRLRERLDALLANEEISQTAFDAATTALGTAETRALAALDAQGLNEISEAAQAQVSFINGAISNLRTTLELTDDPAEVQQILEAIRVLVGARFDILRAELEAIRETLSPEEYQQAFDGLNLAERLAFQNLDTEVFSAISAAAQMQVDFINGAINNLRLSLELTDDPAEIEQILNSIKVLVGARFDILIQELKDIEENLDPAIFTQALKGLELGKLVGIQNIGREITTATTPVAPRASVSRVATEIRNIALETAERQTNFIDGTLDNLRTSLALTDDPAEIEQILDAIKTLTSRRFDSLRAELEAIRRTLSPEEYEQALTGLNLGETLALNNINTEKFAAISAEAQSQVDFVNGGIENLRLSIQLTDDPTERQQILDAIKILVMQRFTILRTELENIRESLSPEDYQQALTGLNLGEQLALDNLDTEKFDVISAAAQAQVDFINRDIENLRTAFELADDPAERQQILDAIKILTQARFDILREELEAIRERLKPEDYQQALTGLNLGETLAIENIDTEKFGVISAAAQKQVDFVNGAISNLELAFQLTDDPAEAQQILDAIKILVAKRFEILIEELKAIEDSFDDPAVFAQALQGLELAGQVAVQRVGDRSIGITLQGFTGRISETDAEINALFDDLSEQTTTSGINTAVDRLRTAITAKYDLIRERIEASAEREETQAEQIAAVNVQEASELQRLGEQGLGAFDSLINTAQFLLDNATEAQFSNRREQLITAINTFYDERLAFINGLDLSDTDRANMLAVVDIQRNIAVEAVPQMHQSVVDRLELEKDLQADIADLRDDAVENEADRQRAIADLYEDSARRREAIEEDHQERLEDIRRSATESREDTNREFQRDIEDTLRAAGADESLFRSGDFDRIVSAASGTGDQDFLRRELDRLGLNLSDDDLSSIRDLAVERQRDTQDLDIRTGRAQAEAVERQTDALEALAQQTEQREADIQAAFAESSAELVTSQGDLTTELRNLTATLQGAPLDAAISDPLMATVSSLDGTVGGLDTTVGSLREPIEGLREPIEGLRQMTEQGSSAIEERLQTLLGFSPTELTQSEFFERVASFTQGGTIAGLRNTYASGDDALAALVERLQDAEALAERDREIEQQFGVITETRAARLEQLENERLGDITNLSLQLSGDRRFSQPATAGAAAEAPEAIFADVLEIFGREVNVRGLTDDVLSTLAEPASRVGGVSDMLTAMTELPRVEDRIMMPTEIPTQTTELVVSSVSISADSVSVSGPISGGAMPVEITNPDDLSVEVINQPVITK